MVTILRLTADMSHVMVGQNQMSTNQPVSKGASRNAGMLTMELYAPTFSTC